jgi:prenyltransferase beta subunit
MGTRIIAVVLALAAGAFAQEAPEFADLEATKVAIQEARSEALKRIDKERLLIPTSFLEAEAHRHDALDAWGDHDFDGASAAYKKAWPLYGSCLDSARAELKRLTALRQKKPPEVRLGFKQKKAIHLAVQWLARHQDAIGRWDCDRFMKHDPKDDQCDGAGAAWYDVGVTALATLVFLEAGYTDRDNHYALEVYRGLGWLISQQSHDGVFGSRESTYYHYNHAISTLVVAKALAATKDKRFEAPVKRAVDYIVRARSQQRGGWRYDENGGETDTSVTTWCYRALVVAKAAGIEVDLAPITAAMGKWVASMTTSDGRIGYNMPGEVARPEDKMNFRADRSRAMTGAGSVLRLLVQGKKFNKKQLAHSLDRCLERRPDYRPGGDIDMYYWYYATLASRADKTRARKWQKPLHRAVLPNQHKAGSGSRTGSWDPIGVWGAEGGRVYSTALLALTLLHAG